MRWDADKQGSLIIKAIGAVVESIKKRESSDDDETAELAHMENAPAGAYQESTASMNSAKYR